MRTKPEARDGYIFDEGTYKAKRAVNDSTVKGILVRDEITGKIKGILNEENDYAELAYIDESTIIRTTSNEPIINYLVVAVDGITCEVTTFKISMTESDAIEAMKKLIDGEPDVYEDGTLLICIECDEISMITDTYVKCIPINSIESGKLSDLCF